MSYDEHDAAADEAYDAMYNEIGPQWAADNAQQLYEENYDQAVREFTNERLRSYYEAHPLVAQPAVDALIYSKQLLHGHPKAAFVFAATATELAWKDVLFRPMLAGLIHIEELALPVIDLATKQQGFDRFRPLLIAILERISGSDLKTFARVGSDMPLVNEIAIVADDRNKVLHAGRDVDSADADRAIAVAQTLLKEIYSGVLRSLSLAQSVRLPLP